MQAYMHSLRHLLEADDAIYWPTHGPAIRNPRAFVHAYIAHRDAREIQILTCLQDGARTIEQMVETMYADVDPRLHPAAAR